MAPLRRVPAGLLACQHLLSFQTCAVLELPILERFVFIDGPSKSFDSCYFICRPGPDHHASRPATTVAVGVHACCTGRPCPDKDAACIRFGM
jgi:hypothetical protein